MNQMFKHSIDEVYESLEAHAPFFFVYIVMCLLIEDNDEPSKKPKTSCHTFNGLWSN